MVLFPVFMYGDRTTCRRKMKAEAKKWAKCYAEGRPFPEPKLIPVPPGSVMFMDESTAHWVADGYSFTGPNMVTINGNARQEGLNIQWRPYLLHDLQQETQWAANLNGPAAHQYRQVFTSFACQSAWGAISVAALGCLHNSIELTVPRVEAVLRFWEPLDTLRYPDVRNRPASLAEFMTESFHGVVLMWNDHPTGNIRLDLPVAIEKMRNASADEIHARVLKRLYEHVDVKIDGLAHRDWLKSAGVIEANLERLSKDVPTMVRDLASGNTGELEGCLVTFERAYGPDAQRPESAIAEKPSA